MTPPDIIQDFIDNTPESIEIELHLQIGKVFWPKAVLTDIRNNEPFFNLDEARRRTTTLLIHNKELPKNAAKIAAICGIVDFVLRPTAIADQEEALKYAHDQTGQKLYQIQLLRLPLLAGQHAKMETRWQILRDDSLSFPAIHGYSLLAQQPFFGATDSSE